MRALVTGASGFIGSTLIEELGTLGFDVYALMRKTSSAANLEGLKYVRVDGDLNDLGSLQRAVRGMDYVFHLAGVVTAVSREEFFRHNTEGTRLLAQAVAEQNPGLHRFVFVSSLAAGGPASGPKPKRETEGDQPVSAYGESKLRAEHELLRFRNVFPISVVRPPIVYGPRDKSTFIFFQTVARNIMPVLKGSTPDGHKYYSAIHVKDLCRGIVQAALAPRDQVPSGEVFYLAGDEVTTYVQFLSTIAEHLNRDPLKIHVPRLAFRVAAGGMVLLGKLTRRTVVLNQDKFNELMPDYWICSNEKAKRLLGFAPEYDLGKGIRNSVEWYQRQKWI